MHFPSPLQILWTYIKTEHILSHKTNSIDLEECKSHKTIESTYKWVTEWYRKISNIWRLSKTLVKIYEWKRLQKFKITLNRSQCCNAAAWADDWEACIPLWSTGLSPTALLQCSCLNVPWRQEKMVQGLQSLPPVWETQLSSWVLALAWLRSSCCHYSGSDPASRSFSTSSPPPMLFK